MRWWLLVHLSLLSICNAWEFKLREMACVTTPQKKLEAEYTQRCQSDPFTWHESQRRSLSSQLGDWAMLAIFDTTKQSWEEEIFSENNNDEDDLGLGLILVQCRFFPMPLSSAISLGDLTQDQRWPRKWLLREKLFLIMTTTTKLPLLTSFPFKLFFPRRKVVWPYVIQGGKG